MQTLKSGETKPFFTIFTPVFNGEKHIHRVFQSICKQTFKDFEWIVINDGSTDNSEALIKTFIEEHKQINTIYVSQANSGKHLSWNKAVEMARDELFVPAMQMIHFRQKFLHSSLKNG